MTYSNADFTPGMKGYSDIKPFRFWCQKVLPLVYDDSLSYYELLCKVTDYINNIITDLATTEENVGSLLDAYNQLQDYVNNYFTNLDVQEEINNKLDDLVEDGTLTTLIGNYIQPRIDDINEELDAYESEMTANFNGLQSATESNLQQQNDKIFVLESRMDTFSQLTPGSTTGDAELADIRVDFEGITHTTAGDATRSQAKNNFLRVYNSGNIFETKQGKLYEGTTNIPYHERHSNLVLFNGTFGTGNANYYFRMIYPASMTSTGSISTVESWSKELTLYPNKRYKLAMQIVDGTTSSDVYLRVKNANNTIIASIKQNEETLFNVDYAQGVMVYLHITAETSLSNCIFKLTLEQVETEYDVIIFMGQSNMAGRGTVTTAHPENAPSLIPLSGYEFRAISDPTKLYPITKTMGLNENTINGINDGSNKTGSMLPAFVNAYYKETNTPIIAISASEGGSSISGWQPDSGNLADAMYRWTVAISWLTTNGFTIRNKFMCWCQGESDGDNGISVTDYKTGFMNMLNAMLNSGVEKCFLFRIGEYNGTGSNDYTNVIQAQTELAQTEKTVVLATANQASFKTRNMMKDQFHYYQDAYNEMGTYGGINVGNYVNTLKEPTMYDTKYNNLYYSHKN
jgi:hypothetical protein